MAVNHYSYNAQTPDGAALRDALARLEDGYDELKQTVGAIIQMKDGADLTDYCVGKYGFADVATATAALAELESLKGALDGIAATLTQAFNRFRNG
jgi:hypothetical protein